MKVHSCAKLDVLVLRRSTVLLYGSVVPCAVLLPSCAAFNYLPDVHLDVWASSLHIDPKQNSKTKKKIWMEIDPKHKFFYLSKSSVNQGVGVYLNDEKAPVDPRLLNEILWWLKALRAKSYCHWAKYFGIYERKISLLNFPKKVFIF